MNRLTRAARDQWRKELAEKGLFKDYDMKSVLTRLLDDIDALEQELEQAAAREALLTQRMDDAAHDMDGNFIDSALSRLRERSGITSDAARALLEIKRKWDEQQEAMVSGRLKEEMREVVRPLLGPVLKERDDLKRQLEQGMARKRRLERNIGELKIKRSVRLTKIERQRDALLIHLRHVIVCNRELGGHFCDECEAATKALRDVGGSDE